MSQVPITPCMVDEADNSTAQNPKTGISWGKPNEDGEILCVRNTFIDVESDSLGGLQAVNMHDGGAQTWTVSAFGLGSRLQAEQPVEQDEGTEEPSVVVVTPEQSLACADFRPSDRRQHDSLSAHTSTPLASVATPDQRSDTYGASHPEPSPSSAAPGLVLLQVPLQLHCGTDTSLFRGSLETSVAVLSQELDSETGSLSLKLQVTLKPPATDAESPAQNVLPQPWLQESKAEAPPQQRRRPSASPGAAAAEKRDGICCHWKHGWCKFGEECKFTHPAEMCGIDSKGNVSAGTANHLTPATAAGRRPSRTK